MNPVERAEYLTHRERARRLAEERIRPIVAHYGVAPKRITIRAQRTRWGSASSLGTISLNYRIVFLPDTLLDYLLVHEVCHLIERNHGVKFWRHVARLVPDHRTHRKALRSIEREIFMKQRPPHEAAVTPNLE